MDKQFLYTKFLGIREVGAIKTMPSLIPDNLSPKIQLRNYQIEAFENTVTYFETENLRKNKQIHLLYHMATGAGKTVMMAGLILYLYNEGYRNFLFFTDKNNIIEKTKENFLNPNSGKYLFCNEINIFGNVVPIKEVQNFSMTDKDAINICFTSIQKLHLGIGTPKENSITIEDFEDDKVVLLSDEAHHVNTLTKKTKDEEEIENNWEYSVMQIFNANRDNILLEFTATADLKDPNVEAKYLDKIIFDYPLAKFRDSGYTKDFQNMQIDYDAWERTLIAIIISEYRRYIFAELKQNIKPVVLLKSKLVKDSIEFYDNFFVRLNNISIESIKKIENDNNPYLKVALDYFKELDNECSYDTLVKSIKQSFSEEKSIIMNGSTDNTVDKQLSVNSLEDEDNPYRLIFTVDMLNEGWDVLNLFDIVRLYETRQSGKKISPYTIKEAQLIGRGARYCPFNFPDMDDRNKRKFDYNADSKCRILETLLYYSKQDSRYISELKQALIATGLLPETAKKVHYRIKEEFKSTFLYKQGLVFSNTWKDKPRTDIETLDEKMRYHIENYNTVSGSSSIYSLFGDNQIKTEKEVYTKKLRIREIGYNILSSASDNFDVFRFDILKSYYPNLNSLKEFLVSDNYMGNITLIINSSNEKITSYEIYEGVKSVMEKVGNYIKSIKVQKEGLKEFKPVNLREAIYDKSIQVSDTKENGHGTSQNEVADENLLLDLSKEDWYVFNDNYGTDEEKAFVKYFKNYVDEFKKKYDEIYLLRNERFAKLAIYSFEDGNRFEPDYVLFLRKKGNGEYMQEQIYIEPKGDNLLSTDKWKEDFLKQLEGESIAVKKYADDHKYKIIGLPFYNRNYRMDEFSEAFNMIIK